MSYILKQFPTKMKLTCNIYERTRKRKDRRSQRAGRTYIISQNAAVGEPASRLAGESDPIRFLPRACQRLGTIPSISIRVSKHKKLHIVKPASLFQSPYLTLSPCHYHHHSHQRKKERNLVQSRSNFLDMSKI